MTSIVYTGSYGSGVLSDPLLQQDFQFTNGTPISVPDSTAAAVLAEQPSTGADWALVTT